MKGWATRDGGSWGAPKVRAVLTLGVMRKRNGDDAAFLHQGVLMRGLGSQSPVPMSLCPTAMTNLASLGLTPHSTFSRTGWCGLSPSGNSGARTEAQGFARTGQGMLQ